MKDWKEKIKSLGTCEKALNWLSQYDNMEDAWNDCDTPEWIIWFIVRIDHDESLAMELFECLIPDYYDPLDYKDDLNELREIYSLKGNASARTRSYYLLDLANMTNDMMLMFDPKQRTAMMYDIKQDYPFEEILDTFENYFD